MQGWNKCYAPLSQGFSRESRTSAHIEILMERRCVSKKRASSRQGPKRNGSRPRKKKSMNMQQPERPMFKVNHYFYGSNSEE